MTRPESEAGFTMIELLVVLVIMPLVIGAIAAAIIISEQDSGVASSRLSDSASAQTISDYYVRDVQGAEYITTDPAAATPDRVCAAGTIPGGSTLELGLYRPATLSPASKLLSVGYWLTSSGANLQLVRYSCDTGGPNPTSQVPITDDLTSPSQVTVSIAPTSSQTAAAAGWTPTSTATASISNVTLSLMEPGSAYAYSLQASPRAWASSASGDQGPASGAALVSLGNVTVSNTAHITVDGNVDINGTLTGTGLTAPGYTITQNASVTDPLSYYLPTSVAAPGTGTTCTISTTTPISAGTYTCQLVVQSGGNAKLGPGVYALQAGIKLTGTGKLTYAGPIGPGMPGVLLYLPCGSCSATFASTASVALPPLNASQSQAASTPSTTALQRMWFWQTGTGISKLIGNGQGGPTSGIAYAPLGTIDLSNSSGSDATGEIVAGTVKASGSPSLTITGQ